MEKGKLSIEKENMEKGELSIGKENRGGKGNGR